MLHSMFYGVRPPYTSLETGVPVPWISRPFRADIVLPFKPHTRIPGGRRWQKAA